MGLRYRKSIKIAPGVKINLNKKSASVTVGGKGYHKTFNSNGQTTTSVNLPVKGFSYTDKKGKTSSLRKSTVASVSSTPVSRPVSAKAISVPKEKKPVVQAILSDPPTVGIAVFGAFLIAVGFFASGSSIPVGIIIALIGAYLIYAYIAHKKHPDSGKYISEEQLARWRQLLSVSSGESYELKKKSLPVLLELKSAVEEYSCHLPESAESLLDAQQKIVDFSEFVIIKGDNPQLDFEKYASMVAKFRQ